MCNKTNQDYIPTSMEMMFIGACGTVTGSATLLKYKRGEIAHLYLVDCGSCQNEKSKEGSYNYLMNLAPKIEKVFLTHAHQDHIGLLPNLIKNGFEGLVFCTRATKELTLVMLKDQLQVERLNEIQISDILSKIKFQVFEDKDPEKNAIVWGATPFTIADGLQLCLLRSGHILGSCSYSFHWNYTGRLLNDTNKSKNWKSITFSGDLGPVKTETCNSFTLKDHQVPYFGNTGAYIVCESTYGSRARLKCDDVIEERTNLLGKIIDQTTLKNGNVLIPSFALNRAQEILLDIEYLVKYKKINFFPKELDLENRLNGNLTLENSFCKKNFLTSKQRKNIDWDYRSEHDEEIINLFKSFSSPKKIESLAESLRNVKYSSLDKALNEKILEIDKKHFHSRYRIRVSSNLIKEVNSVFERNFFDSAKNKKGQIKYTYLSKSFMKKFGFDPDHFTFENELECHNILHEAFNKQEYAEGEKGKVIVASSGMCDKGKILTLLPEILRDPNSTLILTGYQAEGTTGYLLKNINNYDDITKYNTILDLGQNSKETLRLSDVMCRIEDLGPYYSGHADQEELAEYVHGFNAKQQNNSKCIIYLNHGKDESRTELANKIEEMNNDSRCNNGPHQISTVCPEALQWQVLCDSEKLTDEEVFYKLFPKSKELDEEENALLVKECKNPESEVIPENTEGEILTIDESKKKISIGNFDILVPFETPTEKVLKIVECLYSLG